MNVSDIVFLVFVGAGAVAELFSVAGCYNIYDYDPGKAGAWLDTWSKKARARLFVLSWFFGWTGLFVLIPIVMGLKSLLPSVWDVLVEAAPDLPIRRGELPPPEAGQLSAPEDAAGRLSKEKG